MTRRDQLFKWAVYALGLLPVWVLDAFVLSRYPLFGVTPILLPVAAAAVAVLEGAAGGAGFGLWIGLIWTLSYPGVPAAMIFLLTLAGFFTGSFQLPYQPHIAVRSGRRELFSGLLINSLHFLAAQFWLFHSGALHLCYSKLFIIIS